MSMQTVVIVNVVLDLVAFAPILLLARSGLTRTARV
jgi:hypothetical protein